MTMTADDMEKKRDDLQQVVGNVPKIKVDQFVNWGMSQKREAILACHPESLDQIQAVVRGCRQLGIRIRAAGAGHSWSPLFSDEGQLVMYTKDLKRHDGPQIELLQNLDEVAASHVTVMTNVTTGELMDFELSHGVCLPCNVILQVVTYGGVISPACHGVGRDCKSVSDRVTAMRIVDSDGELRTYSLQQDGLDMMKAIQGNMGLFGIIYDITLEMDKMAIVSVDTIFEPVGKVFYDKEYIKKLMEENWSVELFWFPFNGISSGEAAEAFFQQDVDMGEWEPKEDKVWIRLVNKPDKVGDVKPRKAYKMENVRTWFEHKMGNAIDNIIVKNPGLTPTFARTQFNSIEAQNDSETITQQLPHAIHFRDNIEHMPVQDMEWAINYNPDMSNFCKATQHVIERVKVLAAEGKFPLNLAMEMRLMEHSDIYMAPALAGSPQQGGAGHTLYIEVLSLAGTQGWEEFASEVAKHWMSIPGSRPHWCKEWSYVPKIDNYLKKIYSKQFPKFVSQLEKTKVDPDGIFFNDRLEGLLYPRGHPGWKKRQAAQKPTASKGEGGQKSQTCVLL